MKKLLIFAICTTFLQACGGNAESHESQSHDADSVETEIDQDTTDQIEGPQIHGNYALEDFPQNWIQCISTDDGILIEERCDIGNKEFNILKNADDTYKITVIYGHDAEDFDLVSCKLNQREMELYQVVEGRFSMKSHYTDEISEVAVNWNMDLEFCTFEGLFESEGIFFADQNKMDMYTRVEIPCDF